jgi:N4-gp56 family major capsid protein
MADTNQRQYNDPNADPSSIGATQFNTFYYQKKALIEARKTQFFGQMSDTTNLPKNMGKSLKRYHYVPLLDDANINDQGIDAAGVVGNETVGLMKMTICLLEPDSYATGVTYDPNADTVNHLQQGYFTGVTNGYLGHYFTGEAVTIADATTAAQDKVIAFVNGANGIAATTYADALYGLSSTPGTTHTAGGWVTNGGYYNDNEAAMAVPYGGNLYGSSKDVGTISGKMPALSETGGRVNRVGFKRIELEGSIEKFGFFDEYTQESMDFDTDSEMMMHVNREMINGANEITEDALQIDLLNGAGIVRLGGSATTTSEINGEDGTESLITYEDLMRLSIDLDDNRCPKNTKIITGTRMVDTKVIDAARYIYIGSELIPMVKRMTDLFNTQAFIPVQHYASAGNLAIGEIGTVDQFRIIVVPEMMHWAAAGASVTTNMGYRETGGVYDVFPMLVVGSMSFQTIGFQTDGKTVKFKIKHAKPGSTESYANDPYGETGFMSIKWYYGTIILRPERIALCKSVAEW